MLKLVMVPLDTSSFAEQALPHAVLLARRAQAKPQLVCVRTAVPLDLVPEPEEEKSLAGIAAQLEPELPNAITHTALNDVFGPFYPPPNSSSIAAVLSRHAREHGVDMIVMTTHGRGGVRRAWLGSVADSLIRIASRPVLLIRPTDEAFGSAISADHGIHHIVIPLDGSDTAEQVIPYALNLGGGFGAVYSLVRVVSPLEWGSYEMLSIPAPPLDQVVRTAVQRDRSRGGKAAHQPGSGRPAQVRVCRQDGSGSSGQSRFDALRQVTHRQPPKSPSAR